MKLDKKSTVAAKTVSAAKEATKNNKVTFVKMIDNADLIDNPLNSEDITDTADLEASIREIGFVDPIDVTQYGAPTGKYMIVSGHRRRATGVKLGMTEFPCIIHDFTDEADVENWLLYLNNYRDSSKDPLLYMRRCQAIKAYLEKSFVGNIHEEIARRLGITRKTVFQYLAIGKLIESLQLLVKNGDVGVTSVQPIAQLDPEDQLIVYNIMSDAKENGAELTRSLVKRICDRYADGCRSWAEFSAESEQPYLIKREPATEDTAPDPDFAGLGVHQEFVSPASSDSGREGDRNSEVRREFDPIAAEQDAMDKMKETLDTEKEVTETLQSDYRPYSDDAEKWDGSSNEDVVEFAFRSFFRKDHFDNAKVMDVSDLSDSLRTGYRSCYIGGIDYKTPDVTYCIVVAGRFDSLVITFSTLDDDTQISYRLTWLAAAKFLKKIADSEMDDDDDFKEIVLGYMLAALDAMHMDGDMIRTAKSVMNEKLDELDAAHAKSYASRY